MLTPKSPIIIAALSMLLLSACHNATQHTASTTTTSTITVGQTAANDKEMIGNKFIDTVHYSIDTAIQDVNVDGKSFMFYFIEDKKAVADKNDEDETDDGCVGLVAVNKATNELAYKNMNLPSVPRYIFFKSGYNSLSVTGKLYIEALEAYGGSGYAVNLFQVTLADGKVCLDKILRYGELSSVQLNKDGSELLMADGVWDIDTSGKDGESHFGPHRYNMKHYRYNGNRYTLQAADSLTTTNKYSGDTTDDILTQIKEQEPGILNNINLADFKPVPTPYN